MSVTYAIFQAELKSSLRKNLQALKKRIIGTFVIFFVGIFFSLACIRLIKFVIDNPQLFPEGSTQGYGTLLLIFFAIASSLNGLTGFSSDIIFEIICLTAAADVPTPFELL